MEGTTCSVRLTRRYPASPAVVWAALTDPVSLQRWLGEPAWEDVGARVRQLEPEHVLELDWQRVGEDASVVRVELRRDGDATVLVLDHRRIEARFGMGYGQAWTDRLDRLGPELR